MTLMLKKKTLLKKMNHKTHLMMTNLYPKKKNIIQEHHQKTTNKWQMQWTVKFH
ncbi:hypothetical protein TVAG_574460, partial [Trichomonas vaginalis G3]